MHSLSQSNSLFLSLSLSLSLSQALLVWFLHLSRLPITSLVFSQHLLLGSLPLLRTFVLFPLLTIYPCLNLDTSLLILFLSPLTPSSLKMCHIILSFTHLFPSYHCHLRLQPFHIFPPLPIVGIIKFYITYTNDSVYTPEQKQCLICLYLILMWNYKFHSRISCTLTSFITSGPSILVVQVHRGWTIRFILMHSIQCLVPI